MSTVDLDTFVDLDTLKDILEESRYGDFVCANAGPDADPLDLRKRTKEVYRKNALNLYGKDKLDYITRRYGYGKTFSGAIDVMKGLDSKFVQKIAIGTSLLRVQDLLPHLGDQKPEDLTFEQLERYLNKINPIQYKGETIIPYVATIPHNFFWFYDSAEETKELVQLNPSSRKQTTPEGKAEILAKGFATRELEVGDIFYYGKSLYYVHDTIVTGKGFIGYYFRPLTKKQEDTDPIISMGPTKFYFAGLDASSTIIEDLKKEIGKNAYLDARPHIMQWLLDIQSRDEKAVGNNFSLAATLWQYILSDFHEYCKSGKLFCSTGVCMQTAEKFYKRYKKNPTELKLDYYRIDLKEDGGDWCDHLGEAFIGLGVNHENFKPKLQYIDPDPRIKFKGIAAKHVQRFYSVEDYPFTPKKIETDKLQVHFYNKARGNSVYIYERVRQLVGPYLLVPILSTLVYLGRLICPSRSKAKAEALATQFFHPNFNEENYKNCMLMG